MNYWINKQKKRTVVVAFEQCNHSIAYLPADIVAIDLADELGGIKEFDAQEWEIINAALESGELKHARTIADLDEYLAAHS